MLAYRIQELAFGGLKPATVARLEALGQQLDGGDIAVRRRRADERPISGTKLVREYQGVVHQVEFKTNCYEWQGRPYKSLSAIARAITSVRWNGPMFLAFGRLGLAHEARPQISLRHLHPQVSEEGWAEFNSWMRSGTPARRTSPASARRAGSSSPTGMTMAVSLAAPSTALLSTSARRYRAGTLMWWLLQNRQVEQILVGLHQVGRCF